MKRTQKKKSQSYKTAAIKYVFLDIVDYSRNRSVEAQTDIINSLNAIVMLAVRPYCSASKKCLFIPTGDGICVALLDVDHPFDLHIRIGTKILFLIQQHNARQTDTSRKFNVRIGINENTDNLIKDINGRRNISGAGINIAQRVMGLADGGNILVGQSVYERLSQRERFIGSFRRFHAHIKHDVCIDVYQFVDKKKEFLNCKVPSAFRKSRTRKTKLNEKVAYLIAHTAKNMDFIIQHVGDGQKNYAQNHLAHVGSPVVRLYPMGLTRLWENG